MSILSIIERHKQLTARNGGALWERKVKNSEDFLRVKNLPIREEEDVDLSELYRLENNDKCPIGCQYCIKGPPTLRPIQSRLLYEAGQSGGLLAPIGVGHGKTLGTYLLPMAMASKRALLLVPASVLPTTLSEFNLYEEHWLHLPWVALRNSLPSWKSSADTTQLFIVTYEQFSLTKNKGFLEALQPDLIICDECHYLRRRESARTKRILNYFKSNPSTRFVGLSGTITSRSLHDWAHLARLALGEGAPVPLHRGELQDWADALDEGSQNPLSPGILLHFATDEERQIHTAQIAARHGFSRRWLTTPGIVATLSSGADMSLEIRAKRGNLPPVVALACQALSDKWVAPDGRELSTALEHEALLGQLSQGFYYTHEWEGRKPDYEWLQAHNDFAKMVRQVIQRLGHRYDTQLAVTNALRAQELSSEQQEVWDAWEAVKERSGPCTVPVWLDKTLLLQQVRAWCSQEKRGIIWYSHRAVGEMLAKETGLPIFATGKGIEKTKAPLIISSEHANHKGVNLQDRYSKNLILYPPRSGQRWEQLIGRTHRQGQNEDVVSFDIFLALWHCNIRFNRALEDAHYAQQMQQQPQKLLLATIIGL